MFLHSKGSTSEHVAASRHGEWTMGGTKIKTQTKWSGILKKHAKQE
jgi:hypothetical protein